jgi:hypothetical protein
MAVAKWLGVPENMGPRNFHPPKRADLKYWYREARKVLHSRIPEWQESFRTFAQIDTDTIIIEVRPHGTLFIARKATAK